MLHVPAKVNTAVRCTVTNISCVIYMGDPLSVMKSLDVVQTDSSTWIGSLSQSI